MSDSFTKFLKDNEDVIAFDEDTLQSNLIRDAQENYSHFIQNKIKNILKKITRLKIHIKKNNEKLQYLKFEDCKPSSEEINAITKINADLVSKLKRLERDYESHQLQIRLDNSSECQNSSNRSNYTVENNSSRISDDFVEVPQTGLKVKNKIWLRLFEYQREGITWLSKIHLESSGGILGDEMGLGKTVQIIVFLSALNLSNLYDKFSSNNSCTGLSSCLIVCPTTVMNQWKEEFTIWAPELNVAVLHSSSANYNDCMKLVSQQKKNLIILTSYGTLMAHKEIFIERAWQYLILDEGHKIKNPEADSTLTIKTFDTVHRIILSGTPMQNNLKELWSLVDFVSPGRLGPKAEFLQHFGVPITQGGYLNASPFQVETAYRCACTLRDLLKPLMLRRLKMDVNIQLPSKREQVLFCRLTSYQRDLYQEYLDSRECASILAGRGKMFSGLIILRKLCNHPDLVTGGPSKFDENIDMAPFPSKEEDVLLDHLPEKVTRWTTFGSPRRSGKLLVTLNLLKNWHSQEAKVLLFSQSRKMLDIIEKLVNSAGYKYLRMDGTTSISCRNKLIGQFNNQSDCFIFLLTTKVGGLGLNLTAANRVLIFDPDWNPTTDLQARERAWRLGQEREVTIYRLIASGTIEEKMYHRQIFKQFLSNRILRNPRQQRFFKVNDLLELFTLSDEISSKRKNQHTFETNHPSSLLAKKTPTGPSSHVSETADFLDCAGMSSAVNRFDSKLFHDRNSDNSDDQTYKFSFEYDSVQTKDRKKDLRALAKRLSAKIAEEYNNNSQSSSSLSKHLHPKGKRVEGKRIFMLDNFKEIETPPETLNEDNKLLLKSNNPKEDDFISNLLMPASQQNDRVKSWNIIQEKRSQIHEDLVDEAQNVARDALEKISHARKRHSKEIMIRTKSPKRKKSKKEVKLPPTDLLRSQLVISIDESRLEESANQGTTIEKESFDWLSAHRLTQRVISWLNSFQVDCVDVKLPVVFGTVKDNFLFNKNESRSDTFMKLRFSPDQSSSCLLQKGNVRFSSQTLISLIKARNLSRNFSEDYTKPELETQLRKLAIWLIKLFLRADSFVKTTHQISNSMLDLDLVQNDSSLIQKRHVKAILSVIANNSLGKTQNNKESFWTLKQQYVLLGPILPNL